MSFFSDLGRVATGVATGGVSEIIRRGDKKREEELARSQGRDSAISQERKDLLTEGLTAGRDKAAALTGQDEEQTGADIQDIIRRRRENVDKPSRAASEIRARGQQTARRIRQGGGSEAQQRQNEIEVARAAGIQEDVDYERRLEDFQDLMGNVMATQSALEPAYGQLYLASQHVSPEERDQGLLGDLFQGLGL